MVCKLILMNKGSVFYFCLFCFAVLRECSGSNILSLHRTLYGDAFILKEDDEANIIEKNLNTSACNCVSGSFVVTSQLPECSCQCNRTSAIFREDLLSCVQDINECPLDYFEMIPQAHIHQKTHFISTNDAFPYLDLNQPNDDDVSLFCIIVKGQYLTLKGWKDMEGTAFDLPLRLRSEEGNISFEWAGNTSSKEALQGHVILIHLLCKNAASSESTSFQQCVTFRIEGHQNFTEAIYLSQEEAGQGNSLTKGILIAIGLLLASLTISYILISFFYFRVKRKRLKKRNDVFKRLPALERGNLGMSKNYFNSKNIQNDFKSESPRKKTMAPNPPTINNAEEKIHNSRGGTSDDNETEEEDEDEIYSTPSLEEEVEGRRQRLERLKKEMEMEDMQLRECEEEKDLDDYDHYEATASSLGLAIVETSGSTETSYSPKDENQTTESKPVVGMRPRKRLFFNPSYFDPEMLQSPPPAAMEFLSNVRQMMAVAKQKIHMKSFQPTLIDIPEDYGRIKENKSNLSTLESKEAEAKNISAVEAAKEHHFNDKINEIASHSNTKEINKTLLSQNTEDKKLNSVVDNLLNNKETSEQCLMNGMVKNFEMNNKPNNVRTEDTSFPFKADALRLKVQMLQKSPKINNEKRIPRREVKNTSIKRHRSFKENTQAFKNSVEAIKQEIQSKLTRVSSLSRVQSLKRNKKELNEKSLDDADQHIETRKNKVQRWLHSIECGNTEIPANFFANSNIKDKLLSNDPNFSAKESNFHKKAVISTMNFKGPCIDNSPSSSGYLQAEEGNPYQLDTEVYTIDINTHFLEKDSFSNAPNFTEGHSTNDNDYLLPKNSNVTNLNDDEAHFLHTTKLCNTNEHNILDNSQNLLEEHSYEEIQYNVDPQNSEHESNYYPSSLFEDDSLKYEKINENICQAKVSECVNSGIRIAEDCLPKSKTNNFLCIELSDSLVTDNDKNPYSLEKDGKKRKPVKRNDSIVQDSLERPKVKKKTTCDIPEKDYNDIFSLRGIKAFSIHDDNANSDSNTYKADKPLAAVRRSKTMKTFKDYKKIRFCSSKFSENKLTFFGEGINLNYKNAKSGNFKISEGPPPLPPKQLKPLSDQYAMDPAYPLHSTNISLGSQGRTKVRYSNSFTPIDFSRRPKQIFHIYGECDFSSQNYSAQRKHKDFDDDSAHSDSLSNTYDLLESQEISTYDNSCINNFPKKGEQHPEFKPAATNSPISSVNKFSLNAIDENQVLGSSSFEERNSTFDENVREELERYLTNKNDVTNVKQNWKNFLNRIEVMQEENKDQNFRDHLNFFQNNSNSNLNKTNSSHNDLAKPNIKRSSSISLQNFVKKSSASLVHRSVSLHRMVQGVQGNKFSVPDTENPKFSVYINDSFDIED